MINVDILRAQGIADKQPLEVCITISRQICDALPLTQIQHLMRTQGEHLADVLLDSLPGGTCDHLLTTLLRAKASSFVVPHFKESKNDG